MLKTPIDETTRMHEDALRVDVLINTYEIECLKLAAWFIAFGWLSFPVTFGFYVFAGNYVGIMSPALGILLLIVPNWLIRLIPIWCFNSRLIKLMWTPEDAPDELDNTLSPEYSFTILNLSIFTFHRGVAIAARVLIPLLVRYITGDMLFRRNADELFYSRM